VSGRAAASIGSAVAAARAVVPVRTARACSSAARGTASDTAEADVAAHAGVAHPDATTASGATDSAGAGAAGSAASETASARGAIVAWEAGVADADTNDASRGTTATGRARHAAAAAGPGWSAVERIATGDATLPHISHADAGRAARTVSQRAVGAALHGGPDARTQSQSKKQVANRRRLHARGAVQQPSPLPEKRISRCLRTTCPPDRDFWIMPFGTARRMTAR